MIWLLGLALAADPLTCDGATLTEVDSALSVAWVSRVGQSVGRHHEITVVQTSELKRWMSVEGRGSVARLLQRMGLRGKSSEPRRLWKVVIFDVEPADLCRPVAGHDDPVAIGGLVSCSPRASRQTSAQSGCGTTVDRATGGLGLVAYRGEWEDLARNGFCVLPAERFASDASGR